MKDILMWVLMKNKMTLSSQYRYMQICFNLLRMNSGVVIFFSCWCKTLFIMCISIVAAQWNCIWMCFPIYNAFSVIVNCSIIIIFTFIYLLGSEVICRSLFSIRNFLTVTYNMCPLNVGTESYEPTHLGLHYIII